MQQPGAMRGKLSRQGRLTCTRHTSTNGLVGPLAAAAVDCKMDSSDTTTSSSNNRSVTASCYQLTVDHAVLCLALSKVLSSQPGYWATNGLTQLLGVTLTSPVWGANRWLNGNELNGYSRRGAH